MDKLEKHIREHATAFDTATPPEGAEERFLDALEAGQPVSRPEAFRFLRWAIPAAAAILVAVFLLNRPTDWFRGLGNDPDAIYARYLAQVEDNWHDLATNETASDLLRCLTEESIPLIDQLPEELSDSEKAAILQDYYGTLLDGAEKVRRYVK